MRLIRRLAAALLATALATALATTPGFAVAPAAPEPVPFTEPAFIAAQHAGKPILVEVTAPWCPTCAKQRPILSQLFADPAFRDLVVYNVDFDTQKDVLKTFGVRMQSTLIVFTGATEKARSTGDTNPDSIRNLVTKAGS